MKKRYSYNVVLLHLQNIEKIRNSICMYIFTPSKYGKYIYAFLCTFNYLQQLHLVQLQNMIKDIALIIPKYGKEILHQFVFLKMLELKYRVEKISKIKRVEDELFLLIFSTRSLTNL